MSMTIEPYLTARTDCGLNLLNFENPYDFA